MENGSNTKFDVIIIGGGVSGLATAATLAKKGVKVALFERRKEIGGYVGTFKRGDYLFEASTHQISINSNSWIDLQKQLGLENVDLVRSKKLYETVLFDPQTYSIQKRFVLPWGMEPFERQLKECFPDAQRKIDDFMILLNGIGEEIQSLRSIVREPLKYPRDLFPALMVKLNTAFSRWLAKGRYPVIVKENGSAFSEIINRLNNPDLQWLLSSYSMYIGCPVDELSGIVMLSLMNLYIETGPAMVKGGTGVLIDSLKKSIESNGGVVFTNKNIASIRMQKRMAAGVTTADGESYDASYVVSTINTIDTFLNLIDNNCLPSGYIEKIRKQVYSPSCLQVYAGLSTKQLDQYLSTSTIFFDPTMDDRERHALSLEPNNYEKRSKTPFIITSYKSELENSDKSTIIIAEFDAIDNWEHLTTEQYRLKKANVQNIIVEKVASLTGLQLKNSEVLFSATPRTMKRYSGVPNGGILGAVATVNQALFNRVQLQTPVKNLFLSGSFTSYTGVGSSLECGVTTAYTLLRS